MMPHHKHRQEENVDAWLMSYADMITLLLCFFIIFVAVSEPKKDKFSAITEGLAGKFGTVKLSTPFDGVMRAMQTVVENHNVLRDISVERTENAVEMTISAPAFYKEHSAEFNDDMVPLLTDMSNTLKSIDFVDYRVTIEGHTDDAPIHTQLYPSNWELSSARAARLARFFIENGVKPNHMRVIGYGDTEPQVPNLDMNGKPIPENRAKNQRVVVRIERTL